MEIFIPFHNIEKVEHLFKGTLLGYLLATFHRLIGTVYLRSRLKYNFRIIEGSEKAKPHFLLQNVFPLSQCGGVLMRKGDLDDT